MAVRITELKRVGSIGARAAGTIDASLPLIVSVLHSTEYIVSAYRTPSEEKKKQ